MSDQVPFTVSIRILNRDSMNTGTPRFGSWTYHHVLPVRIYFSVASMILCVLTHPSCWRRTRTYGKLILQSMCNNGPNRGTVALFVDDNIGKTPTPEEIADIAKRCASPPYGGFGGPNPNQRTDDPHDEVERNCPRSATQVWWEGLLGVKNTFYRAMGLNAMPQPQQLMTTTKLVWEWCRVVEEICVHLDLAKTAGLAEFERTDWLCDDGMTWTTISRRFKRFPHVPVDIRLRLRGERKGYISTTDTPIAALKRRRGFHFLAQDGDYLLTADPPPPGGG